MEGAGEAGGPKDAAAHKQVILVVDGKVMRQFYTSIYLQRLDYHVVMARTAEDAMLFLELTVPLAVIANYDLPGMNGLELLRHVREEVRTRNVPVVIYTSNRDPMVQQACEDEGCAAFLRHPCTLDDLYQVVQRAAGVRPREFVRLSTRIEVAIEDVGDLRQDLISDISAHGMFVSTNEPLPYGSTHWFSFPLPNAPGWIIRVEGQVQHLQSPAGPGRRTGMGVKFLRIGEAEREFVKDFVRQEMTRGLAAD